MLLRSFNYIVFNFYNQLYYKHVLQVTIFYSAKNICYGRGFIKATLLYYRPALTACSPQNKGIVTRCGSAGKKNSAEIWLFSLFVISFMKSKLAIGK